VSAQTQQLFIGLVVNRFLITREPEYANTPKRKKAIFVRVACERLSTAARFFYTRQNQSFKKQQERWRQSVR
tara:strand:+ start:3974 stop:4189 length:216 start_codon:yes stop_codon:yes gene_type:complete